MSTPLLRPCRIRTEVNYNADPDLYADGHFHKWSKQGRSVVAVVELEDGLVRTVAPENFWFTDRDKAPKKLPKCNL